MTEDEYDKMYEGLKEVYPRAFRNVYCGVSVGEGWIPIIRSLCANIHSHIKWKRKTRADQLLMSRAIKKGYDAVLAHVCRSNPVSAVPTVWQEQRAEEIYNERDSHKITDRVDHVEIHQIKEKFGGLRFYYDGGDDYVRGLVTMAESWAAHTCETCGERGQMRHGGWIRTLCDKHEEEYQSKRK